MAKVSTKITLKKAKEIASEIMDKLEPHFTKAVVAGSIRRGKEEIGDIDIALIPKDTLKDNIEDIMKLSTKIGKKQIFGTFKGRPINLFLTDKQSWGAQLMAATGPARYNIRKRFLVKRQGMKLSPNGLFNGKGEFLAGKTEKDIYDYLGWTNTAPAERE